MIQDFERAFLLPAEGQTRLILAPDDAQVLTNLRVTDCRTALTRGVKEYIEQLRIVINGRESRFKHVLETYAESEQPAEYPGACIYAPGDGTYDASNLTPIERDLDSGLALFKSAEYSLDILVELWASDPKQRMALVAMLEDAFDPVDFMTGFVLELPHYHNVRAIYEKRSCTYEDIGDQAQRRWRKAIFTINGTVSQLRSLNAKLPRLQTRTDVTVDQVEDIG